MKENIKLHLYKHLIKTIVYSKTFILISNYIREKVNTVTFQQLKT